MNKKKKILILSFAIVFALVIVSAGVIFAAPSITLSGTTSDDTASLNWTNNDTEKSYNYDVKKSVNGGDFESLTDNEGNKVNVLNVYPDAITQNITFTTYDGEDVTIKKSASLKQWMEAPNSTDSRGYGRGLIEVTPVSVTDFNNNPSAYLYKDANGKYNYQVVVFGTWDGYASQDISAAAASVMKTYLSEGNSCVVGHDTIRGDEGRAENFASLRSYFNIKTVKDDGVTLPDGSVPTYVNINDKDSNNNTKVVLQTNNVFTTYPWYIGSAGTVLTVPHCHTVSQVFYGNVEITFQSASTSLTDQNGNGRWNAYLAVYNNTAMIQTGHSSGAATEDEQKIWANLLFYLGDVNTETSAIDDEFKDIDAPDVPTVGTNDLTGTSGTVTYSADDNGTTYKYYVEASERTTLEKTTSNTVTEIRTTGVAGYSYVIDTNETTEPDDTIDTTSTSINYTLGNGPKTYLHIKTIDGAGNVSGVTHVLLHTNVAPELTLSQNPTEWTNGNVVITATGTDSDGQVVSITKPDGTVVDGDTTTYEVEENGTYEFIATDNSGETTTKTITITNIDKVKPEATTSITQPTTEVRGATITINATDDASGVWKITKPDGTVVESDTTTYVVTKPGTYTFKVMDVAKNETTIEVPVEINSDGVEVKYIDQVTKEEIADKIELTGKVDEEYTTSQKDVDGYELVLIPNNKEGKYTIDKTTVTYEYLKQSDVITKYVDENTNEEIADSITQTYKQGDIYTTGKKTISGYTYTKNSGNTTGTVVRDNIEVTYYYKKDTAVTVKYIDKYTEEEIATSVKKTGLQGDDYETEQKTINGYVYDSVEGEATGKMGATPIEVTYKYIKQSNVIVECRDEITGALIGQKEPVTYNEKDTYTTEALTIDGYTLTNNSKNTEGIVAREDITVTYYYKKDTSVTVKYVDMMTGKEIETQEVINGVENQEYETTKKQIEGYEYIETIGKASGQMERNPQEVTYRYKKQANLITEHIDANTGEKIIEDVVKTYKEGDSYEALAQNLSGYVLVEEPESKTGTMGRENITKTFKYKKISAGLVVKYVDKITGELLDQEEYTGNEKDLINLDEKWFAHYVIYSRPDMTQVELTVEAQEVVYYYVRASKVEIEGIDQNTQEVLYTTEVTGLEGDEYSTTARILSGYELVKEPTNKNGVFKRDNEKVVYEYRKIAGKVTVKYVDKETGEEFENTTIEGKVGDEYKTEEKTYENYKLVEVVGDKIGTLESEEKEVVYYYERKTGKVVVVYEDTEGNEIKREEIEGKAGDKYKVEIKEIDGYEIEKMPENTEGAYTDGITEIKVIVKEKVIVKPAVKGKILVKFLDEEGKVIKEEYVQEDEEGKEFYYELPEIDGYEIVGDKEVIAKFIDGELVFEAKYKKIEENVETGDINVVVLTAIFISSIAIIFGKTKLYNKDEK